MIRSEREYAKALRRLERDAAVLDQHREQLEALGLEREQLARALHPMRSFHEQLREEVEVYERMKRGDLGALRNLIGIGRWLIGVRIAKGMTQQKLADRPGVAASQVSRDENNEYHGISVDRAQRIIEALGVQFEARIADPVIAAIERDEFAGP